MDNTPMTDCHCTPSEFPFWCARHACVKTRREYNLCQTHADYFRLWEQGRGPGQPRRSRAAKQPALAVTVLVVTHNRLEYTKLAIDALMNQRYRHFELVIWDNASTDGTREWLTRTLNRDPKVKVFLSNTNVGAVRPMNAVWTSSERPFVAKIDNDTLVPPDLLTRLVECHLACSRLGVVSGCHFRKQDVGDLIAELSAKDPPSYVYPQTHVGGCAVMMRKALFDQFGPIPCTTTPADHPFLDSSWTDYQQWISRAGYINGYAFPLVYVEHMEDTRSSYCIKSPQHEEYKKAMRRMSLDECTQHFYARGLTKHLRAPKEHAGNSADRTTTVPDVENITLFIPLAGRQALWPALASFLERQTWPHERTRLLLLDTSHEESFSRLVRDWLGTCDYEDVRSIRKAVAISGLADAPRRKTTAEVRRAMATIYRFAARETITDYVWILEDDIVPPDDVCERLFRQFDRTTGSVAAPYRSRFAERYVVWDAQGQNHTKRQHGVQIVGGNGFGCVLLRGPLLRSIDFPATEDCDRAFYRQLQSTSFLAKVDWSCECNHLDHEPQPKHCVDAQPDDAAV